MRNSPAGIWIIVMAILSDVNGLHVAGVSVSKPAAQSGGGADVAAGFLH